MQVADHPIMTAAAGGAAYCAYKRRQNRQKIDVDEMLEVGVRTGAWPWPATGYTSSQNTCTRKTREKNTDIIEYVDSK